MLVAIEGPDNLGKSCLASSLAVLYKADIKHAGAPQSQNAASEMFARATSELALAAAGRSIIFDRSCLGEMVYGPLYRKYFPAAEYVRLVRAFFQLVGLIVLVGTSDDMRRLNIAPKNDEIYDYQKAEEGERLSSAFLTLVEIINPRRVVVADIQSFETLDDRNAYIKKEIASW